MEFSTRTIHAGQPSEPGTGSLIAPIFQTSTFEQDAPGRASGLRLLADQQPHARAARSRARRPRRRGACRGLRIGAGGRECRLAGLAEAGRRDRHPARRLRRHVPHPQQGPPASRRRRSTDRHCRRARRSTRHSPTARGWSGSSRRRTRDCSCTTSRGSAGARTHEGALVVVDNTFATPFFQQPFTLGADIVVHSVTKYLAGHSDLIQGAVLARDAAVFEPIKFLQNATGAVPSPFDCWLTLRGLKTLELRMLRHAENAEAIARALAAHPLVNASTSRACRIIPATTSRRGR